MRQALYTILTFLIIQPVAILSGQHYTVAEFRKHMQANKSTGDTIFLVETGYPVTGLLLRIHKEENPAGSFLVTGNDTLYFREGEEEPADENKKFSNLLTFSNPIQSFHFCPGLIKGEIQFYYINARKNVEGPLEKPSKKKRFRLCRTRHD